MVLNAELLCGGGDGGNGDGDDSQWLSMPRNPEDTERQLAVVHA